MDTLKVIAHFLCSDEGKTIIATAVTLIFALRGQKYAAEAEKVVTLIKSDAPAKTITENVRVTATDVAGIKVALETPSGVVKDTTRKKASRLIRHFVQGALGLK